MLGLWSEMETGKEINLNTFHINSLPAIFILVTQIVWCGKTAWNFQNFTFMGKTVETFFIKHVRRKPYHTIQTCCPSPVYYSKSYVRECPSSWYRFAPRLYSKTQLLGWKILRRRSQNYNRNIIIPVSSKWKWLYALAFRFRRPL